MEYTPAAYQFLNHLKIVKNSSEHTIRNYAIDLEDFRQYLVPHPQSEEKRSTKEKIHYRNENAANTQEYPTPPVTKISRKEIRGFLAALHDRKASKKTIVRKIASLRSFFRFALGNRGFKKALSTKLKRPRSKSVFHTR